MKNHYSDLIGKQVRVTTVIGHNAYQGELVSIDAKNNVRIQKVTQDNRREVLCINGRTLEAIGAVI